MDRIQRWSGRVQDHVRAYAATPACAVYLTTLALQHRSGGEEWSRAEDKVKCCPVAWAALAATLTLPVQRPILSTHWGRVAVVEVIRSCTEGRELFAIVRSFVPGWARGRRYEDQPVTLEFPHDLKVMLMGVASLLNDAYVAVAHRLSTSQRVTRSSGPSAGRKAAGAGRQ